MDFSIEVKVRKFTTELFGKRYVFPFYINHLPYDDSNIASKIYYASVSSEILRIARTVLINIAKQASLLLILTRKQESKVRNLPEKNIWKKIFRKQFKVSHKFADTVLSFFLCNFFCARIYYIYYVYVYVHVCMYVYIRILFV